MLDRILDGLAWLQIGIYVVVTLLLTVVLIALYSPVLLLKAIVRLAVRVWEWGEEP